MSLPNPYESPAEVSTRKGTIPLSVKLMLGMSCALCILSGLILACIINWLLGMRPLPPPFDQFIAAFLALTVPMMGWTVARDAVKFAVDDALSEVRAAPAAAIPGGGGGEAGGVV